METNSSQFTIENRIDSMSNQFTKTDWKIVQYLKLNIEKFLSNNAVEIAKQVGVSDASIIRFVQKVGYDGLNEFKFILKQEIQKKPTAKDISNEIHSVLLSDIKENLDKLFYSFTQEKVELVITLIKESKRIFVIGLSSYGPIADIIKHKFLKIGLNIQTIKNIEQLRFYTGIVEKMDIYLMIDLESNDNEIEDILRLLKKSSCKVIHISKFTGTKYSKYTDVVLNIPNIDYSKSNYVISNEIFIISIIDIIFEQLIKEDNNLFGILLNTTSYSSKVFDKEEKQIQRKLKK